MRAHDRYFGEALREMESGVRRDDLWGRAFASSEGDVDRAKSAYLGLLAQRLEAEAGAPEKQRLLRQTSETVTTVGVKVVHAGRQLMWFCVRWAACLVMCGFVSAAIVKLASEIYFRNRFPANEAVIASHEQDAFIDLRTKLASRGIDVSLDQLRDDVYTMTVSDMVGKYGLSDWHDVEALRLRVGDMRSAASRDASLSETTQYQLGLFSFALAVVVCIAFAKRRSNTRANRAREGAHKA